MDFLKGVRIIDATRLLPGGYCTMLLSDMGAKVIKVEEPGLGDYMRATPPTKGGRSPVHSIVNRNKLSIGLDLKQEAARQVLRRLVRRSDVFLEGFRPGAMERLGFSFERVRKLNPRIVYCSISAFGQKSSQSSMPGHDINFEAMAGMLAYGKRPKVPAVQFGDISAGMLAALAILGALMNRKGAVHLDVPIVQSLLSSMALPVSSYLATGSPPSPGSSLVYGSDPYYNLFRTSDGKYIAVAAIEDRFWHNLLSVLGIGKLEGLRFGSRRERQRLDAEMKRVFSSKPRDKWAALLSGKETCATPVLTVKEALESSWARSTKALVKIGSDTVLNNPVRASVPLRSSRFTPAPSLGEQTDAIMASLGYSRRQVLALRRSGSVQ